MTIEFIVPVSDLGFLTIQCGNCHCGFTWFSTAVTAGRSDARDSTVVLPNLDYMTTTTDPFAAFTDAELYSELGRRRAAGRKDLGAGPGRPAIKRFYVLDRKNSQINPHIWANNPRYWIIDRETVKSVYGAATKSAAELAARQWNAKEAR